MSGSVQTLSFQDLLDAVEALSLDDQSMLVEIINKRIIEKRREELVADLEESLEDYRRGEVRRGAVDDLLKDLEEDLRD
jgi:hypothetical protein